MSKNIFSDILSSDIFREEFFVAEAQARLSELMENKGVSRAELARRLNVTRARVTQIFSDESKNFTIRLLVRSFLALGEEPMIISRSEYIELKDAQLPEANASWQPGSSKIDGLTEAVIANLLRASIGERSLESERPKRVSEAKDWASSNVIPFREKAHG